MILERLVAASLDELRERETAVPLAEVMRMLEKQRAPRDFVGAIRGPGVSLIAEVKRASPTKGDLNVTLDAVQLAKSYERAGAAAISVLTEPKFFKGNLLDLANVAAAVDLPVLRKDFVINEYQVYEARAFGADAILLIAAILSDEQLGHLLQTICELGMAALIEVHNETELQRSLVALERWRAGVSSNAGDRMDNVSGERAMLPVAIGINNRNLVDFTVDLGATLALRPLVPEWLAVVSESGIGSHEDVLRLAAVGVDAILVGEALVKSDDPRAKIGSLMGW